MFAYFILANIYPLTYIKALPNGELIQIIKILVSNQYVHLYTLLRNVVIGFNFI